LKATPYFTNSVLRGRPYLSEEVCEAVLANPARREVQPDGRVRCRGRVGDRWPRVVVEDDALHNAVFDRGFKP
jgi:hypothetical protein